MPLPHPTSPLGTPRPARFLGRTFTRTPAFLALLASCILLSVYLASRLSLFDHWRRSNSPFSTEVAAEEAEPLAGWVVDHARTQLPRLPGGKPTGVSDHLHPRVAQRMRWREAVTLPPTALPPPPKATLRKPVPGTAESSHLALASPVPSLNRTSRKPGDVSAGPVRQAGMVGDPRFSSLGPQLDHQQLHGGWQLTRGIFDRALAHPNATLVSTHSPRLVLVRGFLSGQEVEHLVGLAQGDLARSEVVSDQESRQDIRTSYGAWLTGRKRDAKVLEIQDRIHQLIGIPERFGESMYVLRYENGQKYDAHVDACAQVKGVAGTESCRGFLKRAEGPGCGPGAGGITCGDRLATFIIYLRSPAKGGATAFPKSRPQSLTMPGAPGNPAGRLTRTQKETAAAAIKRSGLLSSTNPFTKGGTVGAADEAEVEWAERDIEVNYGGGDIWDMHVWGPTMGGGRTRYLAAAEESGGGRAPAPAPSYCDDRAGVLQVRPEPGDAVFFWDYAPKDLPDKQDPSAVLEVDPDPASLHSGCPVVEGTKMIVTRWIRSAEFY
ncbi:hypothetical protein N2152v2_009066 [Parachlorella kessleri]